MPMPEKKVEFRAGELCISWPKYHIRIRAWPNPRAYCSKDGVTWNYFWPEGRFIEYPMRKRRTRPRPKKASSSGQLEFGFKLPPPKRQQTEEEAFELLRETIPPPYAEILAPFWSDQWNPLVFLSFNPSFMDLLQSSPTLAFYLANHKPVSSRIYKEPGTFLPKLIGTPQVDLLDYIDLGCSRQMLKIVRKIRPESACVGDLEELLTIRHKPKSRKLLSHLEHINHDILLLTTLHDRALVHVTPQLLEDLGRDEYRRGGSWAYPLFKECFRRHWDLHPHRNFPRITCVEAIVQYFDELVEEEERRDARKIKQDLGPFPAPPIPDSEHIKALTSDIALFKEGREQHNCAGGYGRMVRNGGCYLYKVLKPERATLRVAYEGNGWYAGELKATCNKPVQLVTERAVNKWLEAHQPEAWG